MEIKKQNRERFLFENFKLRIRNSKLEFEEFQGNLNLEQEL